MQIVNPDISDIEDIIQLAKTTWQHTYVSIISQEQIDFMLAKFYNQSLIQSQFIDSSHFFLLAKEEDCLLGYAHCYREEDHIKLSKLYIDPTAQGKGVGKRLMKAIEEEMNRMQITKLKLNVNRANPALNFYQKMGFEITQTVDIPLDKYWLNDYVMEKNINF